MAGGDGPKPPIEDDDICSELTFEANLQSLNKTVVSGLFPGTELSISVQGKSVVAKTALGGVVGSVVDHVIQLRTCIEKGFSYKGTVLQFTEGSVRIRVEPS